MMKRGVTNGSVRQSNQTVAPEEAGDAWKKDVYEER